MESILQPWRRSVEISQDKITQEKRDLISKKFHFTIELQDKDCTLQIAVKGKSGGMVKHVLRLVGKCG